VNGRRRRRWTAPTGEHPAWLGERGGRRGRSLGRWALAGAGGVAALLVLHVWTPPDGPGFIICPLRRFTGLPCPGCGMTRAFAHLAKGEWSAAIHDHPLAPLLAAELALAWAAWGVAAAGLARFRWIARSELVALGHVAVLVAVWLGRMATGTLPW
jgi:hypothetical protein